MEDLVLPYKLLLAALLINVCITCLAPLESEAGRAIPINLFNIGNSIGEGEAADGIIGVKQHDVVWSTGYNPNDIVVSLNERFEAADPAGYYENNAARDTDFNQAVSETPAGRAGLVAILLGNNDVCASSLDAMTPPEEFESQYRGGLDALAKSTATKSAYIQVSGVPAIYWLWEAMRNNDWCRFVVWPFVPCQNLLDDPINDCGSGNSHLDPDTIHADDGPECIRRKQFHAKIRDIYNPILRNVLKEYKDDGRLPNAYYVDIFDIQFGEVHVNDGDCFHPSTAGHALLADEQWCRSPWGRYDPSCGRLEPAPWLPLLLLDN
jgi:hypothetical protein